MPGLRWHLPWPIETKQIVNIQTIESFSEQTRMLTSDENLVDINLEVQFRRANALDYAFNVFKPEDTLKEVSESAIREVIGRSKLDGVLESGRQDIVARTKELIQRTLDAYKIGLEVTDGQPAGRAGAERSRAGAAGRDQGARGSRSPVAGGAGVFERPDPARARSAPCARCRTRRPIASRKIAERRR